MTHQPSDPTPNTVPSLLHTALQTYQRGEHATARAIVRRLSVHHPEDPRVWMTLARIAETRAEQRHALERVLVFDPANQTALRGLARFDELNSRTTATLPRSAPATERVALPHGDQATDEVAGATPEIRWPLYVVIGVALLVVLVAYLLLRPSREMMSVQPTSLLPGAIAGATTASPTPSLLSSGAGGVDISATSAAGPPAPTLPAVLATELMTETVPTASSAVTSTDDITAAATVEAPTVPVATAIPTATEPPPGPTVAAQLPVGQLVTVGNWTASLLRPAYATMLEGSIGALQPQGRFVLALMSVANSGAPQPIPENLFTLVDGQGRRYQPVPAASTAYLQTYGQAQAGDFAMDQPIPGGDRTWSVPIIFDVPPSVQSLTLQVGDTSPGWPVEVAVPQQPTSAGG